MDISWYPDNDRPSYSSVTLRLAATAFQVFSHLLPSRLLRIAFGLPFFTYCGILIRTHTAGTTADDYLIAVGIFWQFLRWFDLAILTDEKSLWQRNHAPAQEKNSHKERSLSQQLRWAFELCTTFRGVGWNWQVKNINTIPTGVSRRIFATKQLLKFVRAYLISDFVSHCLDQIKFPDPRAPDISGLPALVRLLVSWGFVFRGACDLCMMNYLVAAIMVFIGLSEPQEYPSVFGSWFEMYTVRKAWGYCWHQYLRRIFEVYTNLAATRLGLKRGSFARRYFTLYGAFFLSAGIHYAGCLNVPWTPGTKYHVIYFLIQPIIISLEDFVICLGRIYGIQQTNLTKFLGYIWTFIAFSYSLPFIATSYYCWAAFDNGNVKRNPLLRWKVSDRMMKRRD